MTDYPVGSEYAIRVTGRLYKYLDPIMTQYARAAHSKNTRLQAESSIVSHQARRVIEKCHQGFIAFAREQGYNAWFVQKYQGNIFIVFYEVDK